MGRPRKCRRRGVTPAWHSPDGVQNSMCTGRLNNATAAASCLELRSLHGGPGSVNSAGASVAGSACSYPPDRDADDDDAVLDDFERRLDALFEKRWGPTRISVWTRPFAVALVLELDAGRSGACIRTQMLYLSEAPSCSQRCTWNCFPPCSPPPPPRTQRHHPRAGSGGPGRHAARRRARCGLPAAVSGGLRRNRKCGKGRGAWKGLTTARARTANPLPEPSPKNPLPTSCCNPHPVSPIELCPQLRNHHQPLPDGAQAGQCHGEQSGLAAAGAARAHAGAARRQVSNGGGGARDG